MNMELAFLVVIYLIIIIINYKVRDTVFDAFFFVVTPYVVIILLNNLCFYKNGFLRIPEGIIIVHIIAIVCFYMGNMFGDIFSHKIRIITRLKNYSLDNVSMRRVEVLTLLCIVIVGLDMLRLIHGLGISGFIAMGDNIERTSLAAHLTITLVPLSLLLFDFYCELNQKRVLILLAISYVLIFLTFIKYHIISSVLSLFMYSAIKRPQKVKKMGTIVIIVIVLFFVLNYAMSFAAQGINVNSSFYLNHLWTYIGGSTINVANAQSYLGDNFSVSLLEWTVSMALSFPLMVINGITGLNLTRYQFCTTLPRFDLGADSSNVVSILGSAYLQGNKVSFCIFMFCWGWLVQILFVNGRKSKSVRSIEMISIFLAYNVLSFFSSFFELSLPWETVVQAFLIFWIVGNKYHRSIYT